MFRESILVRRLRRSNMELIAIKRNLLQGGRDGAVISRSGGKRLLRQPPASGQAHFSLGASHFGSDGAIIIRRGHNGHIPKVLGRRAHHRRAANIDVLNQLVKLHARHGGRLFKSVEVHHHHVDRLDSMLPRRSHMAGITPDMQNAPVDFRVKGLYPPIHHLREAG